MIITVFENSENIQYRSSQSKALQAKTSTVPYNLELGFKCHIASAFSFCLAEQGLRDLNSLTRD